MITRNVLTLVALLCAFCVVTPGIYAGTTTTETTTTIIDASSENSDIYDEIVNVANNSSATNFSTWDPTPSGLWIGGSTEESLFQFSEIMPGDHYGYSVITWEFELSSSQIMNGVAEWRVRTPLYIDDSIVSWSFVLYKLDEGTDYWVDQGDSLTPIVNFSDPTQMVVYYYEEGYSSSYSDSDNWWTMDNRLYLTVVAPILPDTRYMIVMVVDYDTDARVKYYLSPNDVCSDEVLASNISRYIITSSLGEYVLDTQDLALDLGFSFDMLSAFGNGVTTLDIYFKAGDTIYFWVYGNISDTSGCYHVLTVPFWTDNGSAKFSVEVWNYGSAGDSTWSDADQVWYNYILSCSDTTRTVVDDDERNWTRVKLTSSWDQKVTFLFMSDSDLPLWSLEDADIIYPLGIPWQDWTNTTYDRLGFVQMEDSYYGLQLYGTYQLSTDFIDNPDVNVMNPELDLDRDYGSMSFLSNLCIQLLNVFVAPSYIGHLLVYVVTGESVGKILYDNFVDIAEAIERFVRNAIDAVMDILLAIGEFIWSIGEYIYDALTWLSDLVVEYGVYLLGLLIIGAALALFFAPLYAQLKLWGIVFSLAEGRFEEATKKAQDLAATASSAAGAVGGLIK